MTRSPFDAFTDLKRFDSWMRISDQMEQQLTLSKRLTNPFYGLDLGHLHKNALNVSEAAARTVDMMSLPSQLELYRPSTQQIADRIASIGSFSILEKPELIRGIAAASSLSNMLGDVPKLTRTLSLAAGEFQSLHLPFSSLAETSRLLNAAGLNSSFQWPRFPRTRRLSAAEQRQRITIRLQGKMESKEHRQAKKKIHQYELLLIELIEECMSAEYGDDWPFARLPLCDSKGVLGKFNKRGGDVLDHADWTDYANIISNEEHFEAIFSAGFEEPEQAKDLLLKIGKLRGKSHHPRHQFNSDDLRDLTTSLVILRKALTALQPNYEIIY